MRIDWAVRNRIGLNIRVMNLSFSAPPRSYYWDDPLNQAVMAAWRDGIVVVAEGEHEGDAFAIAEKIKARTGFEYRVTVLGHIQRGGRPSARDRVLATKLGAFAVDVVARGETDVMVGVMKGELVTVPLEEAWTRKKELDPFLVKLIPILAR